MSRRGEKRAASPLISLVVKSSIPGQNNTNPQTDFNDHAVVKVRSTTQLLFDPSYGTAYSMNNSQNQTDWANASLYKMVDQNQDKVKLLKNPVDGVIFTP